MKIASNVKYLVLCEILLNILNRNTVIGCSTKHRTFMLTQGQEHIHVLHYLRALLPRGMGHMATVTHGQGGDFLGTAAKCKGTDCHGCSVYGEI